MNIEILTALTLFAFVSSVTPGPNNMMLMASGANFGLWRTLPHMLGVGLGFTLMVVLVGVGIIQIFDSIPASYTVLKWVSIAYLLYLAAKIATTAAPTAEGEGSGKPMTFLQAVLFQWVNPKAWTMALTSISIYAPTRDFSSVLLVAIIFGIVNLPSVSLWAMLGQQMQRILTSPMRLRFFNVLMASLLVGSLYPVVLA